MSDVKKRSKRQEQRVAEDLGGKVQPASGATPFYKGDVRAPELRVECKTTKKKTYPLSVQEISKIQLEAIQDNCADWAMQIQFEGSPGMNKKVAVMDWYSYLDLRERVKRAEE